MTRHDFNSWASTTNMCKFQIICKVSEFSFSEFSFNLIFYVSTIKSDESDFLGVERGL